MAQHPPLWPPRWHHDNDSGRSPGWENGLFEWVELRGLETTDPHTVPDDLSVEGIGGRHEGELSAGLADKPPVASKVGLTLGLHD
jgi:hypothetical protein